MAVAGRDPSVSMLERQGRESKNRSEFLPAFTHTSFRESGLLSTSRSKRDFRTKLTEKMVCFPYC